MIGVCRLVEFIQCLKQSAAYVAMLDMELTSVHAISLLRPHETVL